LLDVVWGIGILRREVKFDDAQRTDIGESIYHRTRSLIKNESQGIEVD